MPLASIAACGTGYSVFIGNVTADINSRINRDIYLLLFAQIHTLNSINSKCPKNQQGLKTAAVKAWQSITGEETQRLVKPMSSRPQPISAYK